MEKNIALPFDCDTEEVVLGAAMLELKAMPEVVQYLRPESSRLLIVIPKKWYLVPQCLN